MSVTQLVHQLNNDDFSIRERATELLLSKMPSIYDELHTFLQSGHLSPEQKARIERILSGFTKPAVGCKGRKAEEFGWGKTLQSCPELVSNWLEKLESKLGQVGEGVTRRIYAGEDLVTADYIIGNYCCYGPCKTTFLLLQAPDASGNVTLPEGWEVFEGIINPEPPPN